MKFKTALIEVRFSRESGHNARGVYEQGTTYTPRRLENLRPGMAVTLVEYPVYARLEIKPYDDGDIDGDIFIDGRFAYAFNINGVVSVNYNVVRFLWDGSYYVLEYRFRARENS